MILLQAAVFVARQSDHPNCWRQRVISRLIQVIGRNVSYTCSTEFCTFRSKGQKKEKTLHFMKYSLHYLNDDENGLILGGQF